MRCTDKFWKVKPLLEVVRSQCLELEVLEHSSIDEQMAPFTGRVSKLSKASQILLA